MDKHVPSPPDCNQGISRRNTENENCEQGTSTAHKDGNASTPVEKPKAEDEAQQQILLENDSTYSTPLQASLGNADSSDVLLVPKCERCAKINEKFASYKKMMELNLKIIKEKIATTDELIKKYKKKCQENDKNCKKVDELTEKLKKSYSENGALRVELEKAKAANEPLRKTAFRLENEKKLTETQVEGLKSKLKDTQNHLEDVQASISASDQMSWTLHGRIKKKDKDITTLESRLGKKDKAMDKLLSQLKEARVAKRKADLKAKKAAKEVEKMKNKPPETGESPKDDGNEKKGKSKKKMTRKRVPCGRALNSSRSKSIKDTEDEIDGENKRDIAANSEESGSNDSPESDSEEDGEVAAIFENSDKKLPSGSDPLNTRDVLADFAIPSPPLSPIPPSPAPLRHVNKTVVKTDGKASASHRRLLRKSTVEKKRKIEFNDGMEDAKENEAKGESEMEPGERGLCELDNESENNALIDDGKDERAERDERSRNSPLDKDRSTIDVCNDDIVVERDENISLNSTDDKIDNDNHTESFVSLDADVVVVEGESGKDVVEFLGIVSSDGSDSDIDQPDDHSDDSDDEDYSSYDSSDPKYDCVNEADNVYDHDDHNKKENDKVNKLGEDQIVNGEKPEVIKEVLNEDISVGMLIHDQSSHVSEEICSKDRNPVNSAEENANKQTDDGNTEHSQSTSSRKGDEKADLGLLSSDANSEIASSRKVDVIKMREKLEKAEQVNNEFMTDSPEKDCFLELNDDESTKKASRKSCIETIACHPKPAELVLKEDDSICSENEKKMSDDSTTSTRRAKKRSNSVKTGLQLDSESVSKRSKQAGDNNTISKKQITDVNDLGDNACSTASKSTALCAKERQADNVDVVIMVKRKDKAGSGFACHGSAGGEQISSGAGHKDETGFNVELCAALKKVEGDKEQTGVVSKTCRESMKEDLQSTAAYRKQFDMSEASHKHVIEDKTLLDSRPVICFVDQQEINLANKEQRKICDPNGMINEDQVNEESNRALNSRIEIVRSCDSSPSCNHVSDPELNVDEQATQGFCGNYDEKKVKKNADEISKCFQSDTTNKFRPYENSSSFSGQVLGLAMKNSKEMPKDFEKASFSTVFDAPVGKDSQDEIYQGDESHEYNFTRLLEKKDSLNYPTFNDEVIPRETIMSRGPLNILQTESTRTDQSTPVRPVAVDGMEIELSLDCIIAEETENYPQISPLPPSPGSQRPQSISPLPMTPIPDLVSPLLSPPELASPPSIRGNRPEREYDRLLMIAKPRALLPLDSVRMLDFSSNDEGDRNEHQCEIVPRFSDSGPKSNENQAVLSTSTSTFACVLSNSDTTCKTDLVNNSPECVNGETSSKCQVGWTSEPISSYPDTSVLLKNAAEKSMISCEPVLTNTDPSKEVDLATKTSDGHVRKNTHDVSNGSGGQKISDCVMEDMKEEVMPEASNLRNEGENIKTEDQKSVRKKANVGKSTSEICAKPSGKLSPTRHSPRKRKMVEEIQGRCLRSGDKKLGLRIESELKVEKAKIRKLRQSGNEEKSNQHQGGKKIEDTKGRRPLRSNTKIIEIERQELQRNGGRNPKDVAEMEGNVKGKQGRKSSRKIVAASKNGEKKSDLLRCKSREDVIPETKLKKAGKIIAKKDERLCETNAIQDLPQKYDMMNTTLDSLETGSGITTEQGKSAEVSGTTNQALNVVTEFIKGSDAIKLKSDVPTSKSALDQSKLGKAKDTLNMQTNESSVAKKPGGMLSGKSKAVNEKSCRIESATTAPGTEEVAPTTAMQEIPCRDHKQTEIDYAQNCIGYLCDSTAKKQVLRQLSSLKNISSATSIASAIVSYLKTNRPDNLQKVYRRLHENERGYSDSRLLQDGLVEMFTRCPEVPKEELLILQLGEDCAKLPHLNAVVKRLLHFLPKTILNEGETSYESRLSLCRLYTIICRQQNEVDQFKRFIFDITCSHLLREILDKVVVTCFCVWPKVFADCRIIADATEETIEKVGSYSMLFSVQVIAVHLSSKHADLKIKKALSTIFDWAQSADDKLQSLCDVLLTCLQSQVLQRELEANAPGELLGSNAKDIISSFEMLLVHKGWKWCNNYLIGEHLWATFRKWSQNQMLNGATNAERIHDATIVTAIRLIGRICTFAIKDGYKNFGIIVKMCSGILSKSNQISTISQPVQLASAYTLLDVSSTEPEIVAAKLSQWLRQTTFDVPNDLRSRITSLASQEQF